MKSDDLGEADSSTLSKAPLELVVCQVRHEPLPVMTDAGAALEIQRALPSNFTRLEPQSGGPISIGVPGGGFGQPSPGPSHWRIVNADSTLIVSLAPDSFSLECGQYTTWTDFHSILDVLIAAVSRVATPRVTQRVGVRYIDRIHRSQSKFPPTWANYLDSSFLGLANNPEIAEAVRVSQVYNELVFDDARANIRGSIATDETPNGYSFLLDVDCFDERSTEFSSKSTSEVASALHRLNLKLFQMVLTEDLMKEMR